MRCNDLFAYTLANKDFSITGMVDSITRPLEEYVDQGPSVRIDVQLQRCCMMKICSFTFQGRTTQFIISESTLPAPGDATFVVQEVRL